MKSILTLCEMKSILTLCEPEPVGEYPALYIEYRGRFVVLATGRNTGTVVQAAPDCPHPLGEHLTAWKRFDDSNIWKRLSPGSRVELSND